MTQLDDLDDDCLSEVLNRLPLDHLFKMEQLNKRMKRLASKRMQINIKAIALTESNPDFADCSHHTAISQDQVLNLRSSFVGQKHDLFDPTKRDLFLTLLSKCSGVESIHFGCCDLPGSVLREAFKRCPELGCVKLGELDVKEDELNPVLDEFGPRIVHFVRNRRHCYDVNVLAMLRAKCANIRRVDWLTSGVLVHQDLLPLFKQLPPNCWVKYKCLYLRESVFDDVFDELDFSTLVWIALTRNPRNDRLSSLKFKKFWLTCNFRDHPIHGIDFTNLKKLDYNSEDNLPQLNSAEFFRCMIASRFPQIEEFCFSVSIGFIQNIFKALFKRMTTLKKLTFYWHYPNNDEIDPEAPELATMHNLNKLETIYLKITRELNWHPENLIQYVEQYVDGIRSLKKLTVDIELRRQVYGVESEFIVQWLQTMDDEIKRIKLKQKRVKIDLIIRNY